MDRGYVKLWRSTKDSQVFQDPNLLKVWVWCLMRATYKTRWTSIQTGRGTVEVKLDPGQFIFGRKTAAKDLKMKLSSVRNRIKKLKNMQNVDIQVDTHYSIVTVCNWETYQADKNGSGQQSGQPEDRQRTGKGQAKDTNKKGKKDKNKDYTCDFEKFWAVYPKKINKKKAFEAWQKIDELPLMENLLLSVRGQAQGKDWKKDGGQFIPHPSTWLNGKRWEDEAVVISNDDDPPYW